MKRRKYSYRNATVPSGDEFLPATAGESVTDNKDGKVWAWFDKFFGVADQSVDIWDRIRTPVPDPYASQYGMRHPRQGNTLLIVGGLLVAGIVVYAIVKK